MADSTDLRVAGLLLDGAQDAYGASPDEHDECFDCGRSLEGQVVHVWGDLYGARVRICHDCFLKED